MKLIVTRPRQDSGPLADKLRALGHEPILIPLLEIVPRNNLVIPSRAWQAISFTSANAPRTVPCRAEWKDLPVYTVGPQSKAEAEINGYAGVQALGGNVDALAASLTARLDPAAGPILYITGSEVSGDLKGVLERHGFSVSRIEAYDAAPCATPDAAAMAAEADGVLLYSPRSARLWRKVLDQAAHQALPHFHALLPVAQRGTGAAPASRAPHRRKPG
jgi:uroporphyrinogen-III synthase